jgi:tetratricopeptide (TPR) repeat protein
MAVQFWATQLLTLRELQGRLHEMEPAIRAYADQFPNTIAVRAALSAVLAAMGKVDEARAEFEIAAQKEFTDIPADATWLLALSYLSQTAAAVGDAARASTLYDLLAPYTNRTIVTGPAITCAGAAARYLGLLAATMGDTERADRHFREAIDLNQRMGARPYLAQALGDYAELLIRSGDDEDRSRAIELLERAAGIYRTVGMRTYLERAEGLLREATSFDVAP